MTRPPPTIRRVLLVALDNLGDLVFASALVPPIRAAFPAATIDVWCKRYTAEIAALIPDVRDVIAADPFWSVPRGRSRPPAWPFLRTVNEIRRKKYDVAVLSEAPWRAAAAVAATRIPMRVGLARHRNAAFLTHRLAAQDPHKPVVREQARLLTALGIAAPDEPRYRLDRARLGAARAYVAAQLPPTFVAFHPFAASRDRCVPLGEWTQLAFALQGRRTPVLWVGTSDELAELRSSYTQPKGFYVDHLADASLLTTAAALSLASTFVGHDSGPLHVAGAFGVPVVGVFAPGQPDRTFPQGMGPWRIIRQPSPAGITAATMLREIDALRLASAT